MAHSGKSFDHIVSRLRDEFPGVKLLALGQTVYWDEPMKAILRRLLDEHLPDARMIVGIHDADYFSRIPATLCLRDEWAIIPHNDGSTRDLWVATGEISRLFGSETIPSRDLLAAHGVQLDKIARDYDGGRERLIDTATEAWGWRGLVHANSGNEISCCIPLRDGLPHLVELLRWGLDGTLDSLSDTDAVRGRRVADEMIRELQSFAESHQDASITDAFRELLGRFYGKLLGYQPSNIEVTGALDLFRFNRQTAHLPRFRLLEAFLNPETQAACQEAYDQAVEGSDTYTLDRFPPGAIPFDLVIPGRGRGTILLGDGEVIIDLDEPVSLPVSARPVTPLELAMLIESRFGPQASVVGKALTLVLMMASEFIFVLNEQASAYVPRCERLATLMRERGIHIKFNPILRIHYRTWDSLSACDATLRLPGHLASAFRQGEMTSREFADSWRTTVLEQEELLTRIARLSNLDELLMFLAEYQGEPWPGRIEQYMSAHSTIRRISAETEPLKQESVRLRDLSHQLKSEVQALEMRKGEHFRTALKPLRDRLWELEADGTVSTHEIDSLRRSLEAEEQVRAEIEAEIETRRDEAMAAHTRSLDLKQTVRTIERGEEMQNARETLKRIEYEAELARLWLVREAILITRGLTYADHRPSAWWFMVVDPSLRWFNRVAETAEFRFEEIDAQQTEMEAER